MHRPKKEPKKQENKIEIHPFDENLDSYDEYIEKLYDTLSNCNRYYIKENVCIVRLFSNKNTSKRLGYIYCDVFPKSRHPLYFKDEKSRQETEDILKIITLKWFKLLIKAIDAKNKKIDEYNASIDDTDGKEEEE